MDLSTRYLGLSLPHPLMVGASPIVDDLDLVRRAEDAGTAAIVMHSLFEEQLTDEQLHHHHHVDAHGLTHAEAHSFLPEPPKLQYALGPDEYLAQLNRIKERVSCPVIGSLNGATDHGWLGYAKLIEQAGADALELNIYYLPTDPAIESAEVERHAVDMVKMVREAVRIPLAVKLSPFYSSLPHLAHQLVSAGAQGLVLFNRFYEPDIDVEELELSPRLELSTSAELNLRLRWLAILSGSKDISLAVTGGVHSPLDALKAIMAGADGVQLVSALLKRGPEYLSTLRQELADWLDQHEYTSLSQARGSMNIKHCPDPTHYGRGNYLRILQSWRGR
ncbi:MAG: dihydroorotate dehydrogenase-like protein [Myxococcales bacterium]|nr:dihydroorotate dehydrogenase-like protein [Myxococcales bacterium]MDD9971646.1 dihydroorotate dehydrogenase-like protein [Myxococcales bacterium]